MKNVQIEVERPFLLSLEEQSNFQLEMQRLPSIASSSAAMEGFQDCAEEAIRYLLEVENMSSDDPMVVGLRQHLNEKQKSLLNHPVSDIQNLVALTHQQPTYVDMLGHYADLSSNASDNDMSDDSFESYAREQPHELEFFNVMNMCESRDNESAIRSLAEELISLMEEGEDFFTDVDEEDEDDEKDVDFDDSIEDLDH